MSREIKSTRGVTFQADLVRGVRVELSCSRCHGSGRPLVPSPADAQGDCFYCHGHGFVHATLDLATLKKLLTETTEDRK